MISGNYWTINKKVVWLSTRFVKNAADIMGIVGENDLSGATFAFRFLCI
jgi:hypothetical protein